ncbi:MAG TPA: BON domain-containing protein [Candidatus Angelobacter sp.]
MKHLFRLAMILVFGAGFALAQTGMQNPPTTPPTFPSQQQPGTQHVPDETSGQASTPSTTAMTKAQSDIQTALRRQLPASADSVSVSTTDDNKIKLAGTVNSETEKTQIEQIARSAAPDMKIDNKLTVAAAPAGPTTNPPSPVAPPNAGQRPGTESTPTTTPPAKPMPPMGSSFMPQTGSSSQYPSQNPNTGAQSGSNPGSQQPGNQTSPASQTGTQTSATSSSDAGANIQKALQQEPTLANANINATVNGNKVELTGTVADKDQKKKAKEIAEANAGGMKVVDHLKVQQSKGGKDNTTPPKY